MSTLRKAAQAVVDKHNPRTNMSDWWDAIDHLRAALALPETTAKPVAWLNRYHAAMVTQDHATAVAMGFTTPLYASPPCDEWRPASEPPEDGRDVVVWMNDGGHGCFASGHCVRGEWTPNYVGSPVTHWRDVQPPTEGSK